MFNVLLLYLYLFSSIYNSDYYPSYTSDGHSVLCKTHILSLSNDIIIG